MKQGRRAPKINSFIDTVIFTRADIDDGGGNYDAFNKQCRDNWQFTSKITKITFLPYTTYITQFQINKNLQCERQKML